MPRDTIFAPASGSGKAAIAIVRISGPKTRFVLETIAGSLPKPRQATLRVLNGPDGAIDRALIVWFLIVEPHGLARLWSVGKQKMRIWPFPH